QPRIRAQKMRGHRDLLPVRQHEFRITAEFLDETEDVIPPSTIEPDDVILQLPEDLVHLEGGQDSLDQHGGLDRLRSQTELCLRVTEHLRPESRLQVALGLGQIEIRAAAATLELRVVVEQVETEVYERTRYRLAVDLQVLLGQVPAARPDDQRRHRRIQSVDTTVRVGELDAARNRIVKVELSADNVVPGRRHRVFAIRHEH